MWICSQLGAFAPMRLIFHFVYTVLRIQSPFGETSQFTCISHEFIVRALALVYNDSVFDKEAG